MTKSLVLTTVPNQRWILALISSPWLVTWVCGRVEGVSLKNTWCSPSWNIFCVCICHGGRKLTCIKTISYSNPYFITQTHIHTYTHMHLWFRCHTWFQCVTAYLPQMIEITYPQALISSENVCNRHRKHFNNVSLCCWYSSVQYMRLNIRLKFTWVGR